MARRTKKEDIMDPDEMMAQEPEADPEPEIPEEDPEEPEADGSNRKRMKPCPFCGGPGVLKSRQTKYGDYIVMGACGVCDAQTKVFTTHRSPEWNHWKLPECDYAIAAWNMRR